MASTTDIARETKIALNRLRKEKDEIGSYDKLADKYKVNVRYVWDFIQGGIYPRSRKVCKKLGIPAPCSPNLSYTIRRNAKANTVARVMGFKNWSEYTTCMIELYIGELGL